MFPVLTRAERALGGVPAEPGRGAYGTPPRLTPSVACGATSPKFASLKGEETCASPAPWKETSADEEPFDGVTQHRPHLLCQVGMVLEMRILVDQSKGISPGRHQHVEVLQDVGQPEVSHP